MGFSRNTKHESRNTAFFRLGLRSMKIMVREISLIRGLGAPAKEMSFPHHLALFKDHSCPLLPTIARHCPLLPAKKMSQARVASQYGRGSRGPGRVPRAAPRQPGCTAEQTNHEPRPFLALGASRAEEKGASRLARAGVLEQYVEHGKQAQRSPGGRIRLLRPSGGETCRLVSPRRPVTACLRAVGRLWRGMGGILLPRQCPLAFRCCEHTMNPC